MERRINTISGTQAGGLKTRETVYSKYGTDYYTNIGQKGGRTSGVKKGFAANLALAKIAGAKGGRISRRGSDRESAAKIEKYAEDIKREYADGSSLVQLSKDFDISYVALIRWARENIHGYGVSNDVGGYNVL